MSIHYATLIADAWFDTKTMTKMVGGQKLIPIVTSKLTVAQNQQFEIGPYLS